jgi:hypothetical protein
MNIRFNTKSQEVFADGALVGTYRKPDPSGRPDVRSLVWVFVSSDGERYFGRSRKDLSDYAKIAALRLRRLATAN